jgi:hypothetical protein
MSPAARFETRLIPTGAGWWAYQIIRRVDGALVAGGECLSRRRALIEAKTRLADLLKEAA